MSNLTLSNTKINTINCTININNNTLIILNQGRDELIKRPIQQSCSIRVMRNRKIIKTMVLQSIQKILCMEILINFSNNSIRMLRISMIISIKKIFLSLLGSTKVFRNCQIKRVSFIGELAM